MKDTVAVIIPVYNAESTIINCLESVIRQNYSSNEIIIVDNCSTDHSFELVRRYIENSDFPGIQLAREDKRGAAAARNRGVMLAKSEIIAFTDADCQALPDWVEKIVLAFKETPSADIVVGTASGAEHKTVVDRLTYVLRYKAAMMSTQKFFDENSFFKGPIFATLNAAFRKSVFLKLSGFDESFGTAAGEDTDLYLRALKEKMRIVFNPEIKVIHRERSTGRLIFKQVLNYRLNDVKNLKKFFPGTFVLTIPHILFFRMNLRRGTVWIDKFIWLLLFCLIALIPIFLGRWLFSLLLVMFYLGGGLLYIRFLVLKAGLKLNWAELPVMLFYYTLKQTGDIYGRIIGSFKCRIFYI